MTDKERFARLQDEVMATQLKYQKELEKLEKENKELKKQLLLQREKLHGSKLRKIKVIRQIIEKRSGHSDLIK
jgi:optic atrophy protein 1